MRRRRRRRGGRRRKRRRPVQVLSQAMTRPPMMDASYFSPRISPPSPTHHEAKHSTT